MFFNAKPLQACQPENLDGEPGMVCKFSFNDRKWAIRDLLVVARTWRRGKKTRRLQNGWST